MVIGQNNIIVPKCSNLEVTSNPENIPAVFN